MSEFEFVRVSGESGLSAIVLPEEGVVVFRHGERVSPIPAQRECEPEDPPVA